MSLVRSLSLRPRLTISFAVLLAAVGAMAWLQMPREEDPRFLPRWAAVVATYPGADAATVERLLLEPVEEHVAEVEGIKNMTGTVRTGVMIMELELVDAVDSPFAVKRAWDQVDDALRKAHREFPEGVEIPELHRDMIDIDSVVVAITGSEDPLELAAAARRVERSLLAMRSVARVRRYGDPGEQITVELDGSLSRQLGIDHSAILGALRSRNVTTPGGAITIDGRMANINPGGELRSLDELAATPIMLPTGSAIPLAEVAAVRRGPAEPAIERMRLNGRLGVALGIVPHPSQDLVEFGKSIRERIAKIEGSLDGLQIDEVTFQPKRVEQRLSDLGRSMIGAVLIVAMVVLLFMGPRLGFVVAAVVPLVSLGGIGVYAMGGGVLHQMSIAAIVISLGMLVDNAIVVGEAIQAKIDDGENPRRAARVAVKALALPLAAATGTTMAAFLPMLLAQGPTADFTRALPIVIMITLAISYLFAVAVTPALSQMILRPASSRAEGKLARVGAFIGDFSVRHPWLILATATLLVAASAVAASLTDQQFFPSADRNQVLVDLALPEGADVESTNELASQIELELMNYEDVIAVASFVGRGAPHFYYNVPGRQRSPHFAQLLLTTSSVESASKVARSAQTDLERRYPELVVVAGRLEQGTPVAAPIEVRVYADDLQSLETVSNEIVSALQDSAGAESVRQAMGIGLPTFAYAIDDATAARHGLSRSDVAIALLAQTRGLPAGELRSGEEPVPIIVRSPEGHRTTQARLAAVDVPSASFPRRGATAVPIATLARPTTQWLPAVIRHHNRRRYSSVLAGVAEGSAYNKVLAELEPKFASMQLPPDVDVVIGGAQEGSGEANTALLLTLPAGLLVLLAILLAEFNSFRRVLIIMTTVPLSAVGIIPGLLLGGQPFGFMSMLGLFALAGIVVNNAIVLLDVADQQHREGRSLKEAMAEALRQRSRPILLTTATTVGGLVPLAISPTSLWPPLAWSMISGLVASTGLTLFVVPALYVLLLQIRRSPRRSLTTAAAAIALLALGLGSSAALAQDDTTAPGASYGPGSAVSHAGSMTSLAPGGAASPTTTARSESEPRPEQELIDRAVGSGSSMPVERAAAEASRTSKELARAEAAATMAASGAREAVAWLFPRVELSGRYSRLSAVPGGASFGPTDEMRQQSEQLLAAVSDPAARALFAGILASTDSFASIDFVPRNQVLLRAALTVPISQTLLRGVPSLEAARLLEKAADHQLEAIRRRVELQARLAYYELARARAARAVTAQSLERVRAELELLQQRERAGASPRADVLLAITRVEGARAALAQTEAGVAIAEYALSAMMHASDQTVGIDAQAFADPAELPASRSAAIEAALSGRAELLALRKKARAEGKHVRAESSALWPNLALQLGGDYALGHPRQVPPGDGFARAWDASVLLSWSPNDAVIAQERATRAKATQRDTELELDSVEDAVRVEVVQAHESAIAARKQVRASEAAALAAEEGWRVRWAQLQAGAGLATDLMEADLDVARARLAHLSALIDARVADARLMHAMGR